MKFKIGDLVYCLAINDYGFVKRIEGIRQVNKPKTIFIRWFKSEKEIEYPIGSLYYQSWRKVNNEEE